MPKLHGVWLGQPSNLTLQNSFGSWQFAKSSRCKLSKRKINSQKEAEKGRLCPHQYVPATLF